ncbi:MAG: hypothetical protein U0414_11065 [Polyangiaceae bacterium]
MHKRELLLKKRCDVKYDEMRAEDAAGSSHRTCERCETPVHDLSARTEAEARAFQREHADACVRYLHDDEGAVLHVDRPPRIVPRAWLVRTKRAALIAATLASSTFSEACGPQIRESQPGGAGGTSATGSTTKASTTGSATTTSSGSTGSASSGTGP